jgi:hypothetical protein
MKKSIVILSSFLIAFLLLTEDVKAQYTNISVHAKDGAYTYKRKNGFSSLEIQYKGDVEVNSTDTDVTSISSGGYLKINQTNFGNKRAILLEGRSGGEISRKYYEGRKEVSFNEEGKRWLADVLLQAVRVTGIGAESRVARIYKKGGTNGVLQEIRQISSSSGMARYFDVLLAQKGVKELPLIAEKIGSYISSNSTRGNLFRKYAELFMQNDNTARSYFTGISKMSSSSEVGSLLKHILNNYELSESNYEYVLDALRRINSNSERGSVLREINRKLPTNPAILNSYFRVISGMTSNSEKGSVLRDLIRRKPTLDVMNMTLDALRTFTSSSAIGNVLREVVSVMDKSEKLVNPYLRAVDRMTSNSEISNALIELIRNQKLTQTESKIRFLESTRRMTSNSERGRVLRRAVDMLDGNSRVNNAYFDSVRGMTSSTERGSVLRNAIGIDNLQKSTMLSIIDGTRGMTSNSEIASVLVALGRKMPKTDSDLTDAYKSAASRLSSNSEYRRVMEVLD